ncbi:AI-2E family transporter [Prochlorococcus marinus]|uniref:AI-2E family transporter n=1 Tax=Prochlorococcus marinus XMU1408 TaxID=2213228 RepID=A0A318QZX7_PROMR|nr:AI-2E family transporter [Prochlorococcus marinus]MBW3041731.1 AI-2E family transporter [Prochlorococcus marinus str. XMU1408]PYE02877.1 AI-2E family transporter [Prochlorococcus marinus XMU1408]
MKSTNWLSIAALITSILILLSLKEILILFFAAIILSMALCTVIGKIRSIFSIPRWAAFGITLISIILILSISIVIIIPQFSSEFEELINQIPSAVSKLWELSINTFFDITEIIYKDNIPELADRSLLTNKLSIIPDSASLANGVTESITKIISLASNVGIGIIQLFFIISVGLMITLQPNSYREVAILLVPSFYRRRARNILYKCGNSLSSWMAGVLLSSIFVAILSSIGLYLLGIKLVIANALIAGVLNVIPNVGPTISTIFPMSVALLDTPWKSLAVLGLYIVIQNIESYIITPSIMQKQVKLLPGLTITAQFLFTIILGPLGLLLAIPMAVVIQVFFREVIIHDILERNYFTNKS